MICKKLLLSSALLVSGCDYVVGIDELGSASPSACGPYGVPVPVVFDAALAGAHDFSVADDGLSGAVVIDSDNIPSTKPITPGGTLGWALDPAFTGSSTLDRLRGHRIEAGRVLATSIDTSHHQVDEYTFQGIAWQGALLLSDSNFELYAGNARDDDAGSATRLVAVRRRTTSAHNEIAIFNRDLATDPTGAYHEDPDSPRTLNQVSTQQPTHAVLTADRRTIVYASSLGSNEPDLYVTTYDDALPGWGPGEPIRSLNTAGAEDEPWVNGDCSRIWFRRDGVVYEAEAQ
jgi:hypothetical protein